MSPDHNAAPTDFDAISGRWRVAHRRPNARLASCTEWTTFSGMSTTRTVLEGYGNVEDSVLGFPDGPVRAIALRSFDPESRRRANGWLDGRSPHQLDAHGIASSSRNRGQSAVLRHRKDLGQPTAARQPGTLSQGAGAKPRNVV